MSGCATAPPRAPPEIGHPAGRGYCAPSGAAGRMGPAQCPCLLRQREFPGRLRNGRFFESLPAMGTLPAPFGERFDAASAACAGRLAQRPAAPLFHCCRNRSSRASSRVSSRASSSHKSVGGRSSGWCSARGGPGAAPALDLPGARRSRHGCLALMADMPITNERQLQKHLIKNLSMK